MKPEFNGKSLKSWGGDGFRPAFGEGDEGGIDDPFSKTEDDNVGGLKRQRRHDDGDTRMSREQLEQQKASVANCKNVSKFRVLTPLNFFCNSSQQPSIELKF